MGKIVVLGSDVGADGSFSVTGLFRLVVPVGNVVSKPGYVSLSPYIDEEAQANLVSGAWTEQSFSTGQFPSGTTVAEVRIAIVAMYDEAQVQLNSVGVLFDQLIGTFDGTSWVPFTSSSLTRSPGQLVKFPEVQSQSDAMNVTLVGRKGTETLWVTHDWTKPTTWYGDSVRIEEEVLANPSGDRKTFVAAHHNIIDMVHGFVYDESSLREDVPHGYHLNVSVSVGGASVTQREPYELTGGDYSVDYESGVVTFFSAIADGANVTMDYSYENGSTWYLRPYEGTYLDITKCKLQFSVPCNMTDALDYTVYGACESFAPEALEENGGPYPRGTLVPLQTTEYMRFSQMFDEAAEVCNEVPVIGGEDRGLKTPQIALVFEWDTVRHLTSSDKMELRLKLKHDRAYIGERATASFRATSGLL